jgi:hypothetical protein
MTLEEELKLEHQKKVDAEKRIKEIRRQQFLGNIKIGACYGNETCRYVPRDVEVDAHPLVVCSYIKASNGVCRIERAWVGVDTFSRLHLLAENGTEDLLDQARKVLKSHENT